MAQAHRLDPEAAAADYRSAIRSENEEEAVELAEKHVSEVHAMDYTDEELRSEHLQIV